jgi:excisionase family DNA binding protein
MTVTPDGWLSVAEAAQALGVSAKTVQRRAKRGELPYQDTGHGFLIAAAAISKPQAEQNTPPPAAPAATAEAVATDATGVATPEWVPTVTAELMPPAVLLAMVDRAQERAEKAQERALVLLDDLKDERAKRAAAEAERDDLRRRLAALETAHATPVATPVATVTRQATAEEKPAPPQKKRRLPYLLRRLLGDR